MGEAEGRVELIDPPVVAVFRVIGAARRDGLEIGVELFWRGSGPAYLSVSTDRVRGRLADYDLTGTLDGVRLADPHDGAPFMGGPATVVLLREGEPFAQTLPLADFLTLPREATGRLELRCRRRLSIGATPEAAQVSEPTTLEVPLGLLLAHPPGTMER